MNVPAPAPAPPPAAAPSPTCRPGASDAVDGDAPDDDTTAIPADFLAALAKAFATGAAAEGAGADGASPDGETKSDGATTAATANGVAAAAAAAAAAACAAATVAPAPAPATGETTSPAGKGPAPTVAANAAAPAVTTANGATPTADAVADAAAKAASEVVEKQATSDTKPHGGREPGGRETDGGVVASGSGGLGHGETGEVRQPSGGADLSAPSSLPPDATTAHAKTAPATTTAEARTPAAHADANSVGDTTAARPHRSGTGETASDADGGAGGKSSSNGRAQAHEPFAPDVVQAATASTHASTTAAQPSTVAHTNDSGRVEAPAPTPQVSSPPVREPQHAAPPPLPAPAPDVDRLVRLDQMRSMPRRDGGEMRIEVTPDGLGPVEVRVVVRNDAVHATLLSNHDVAREALTAGRASLEAALERSNLRLEGFTVDVGQQQHQSQTDQQRGPSASAAWLRANGFEVPATTPPLGVSAGAAQGLSLRA